MGMVRTSVEQGRDETTIELKRDSCDGTEKHWSEGDLEQQIGSERRLVISIVSPVGGARPVPTMRTRSSLASALARSASSSRRKSHSQLGFPPVASLPLSHSRARRRARPSGSTVETGAGVDSRTSSLAGSARGAPPASNRPSPSLWIEFGTAPHPLLRAPCGAARLARRRLSFAPSARPPFPRTSGYGPRTPPPRWPPRGTWPRRRRRSRRNAGGRARCRRRPSTRR